MSVASDLITALTSAGYPIAQGKYAGSAASYITFNYLTDPDNYADNAPNYERYFIQVHLFVPKTTDTTTTEATIKSLLAAGGFYFPRIVDATMDDLVKHIVFETGKRVYIG